MVATVFFPLHTSYRINLFSCYWEAKSFPTLSQPDSSCCLSFLLTVAPCSLFWLASMEFYIYFHEEWLETFLCIAVLSSPMPMGSKWLPPLCSFYPHYVHFGRCVRRVGGGGREFDRFEIRWQQLWNSRVFANIPMKIKIHCEKSSMSLELDLSLVLFFKENNVS